MSTSCSHTQSYESTRNLAMITPARSTRAVLKDTLSVVFVNSVSTEMMSYILIVGTSTNAATSVIVGKGAVGSSSIS